MRRFALFACFTVFSVPVQAQQSPESQFFDHGIGFVNEAAELDYVLKKQSMAERGEIEPSTILVSLSQEPYMEDYQVGLKLSVPNVMTGCYDVSPLEYEATFIDPYYLDIKVKDYQIKVSPSQAPHYECSTGYRVSEGVIPLNRNDLQKRGTKQIKLHTNTITEFMDLSFEGDRLILKPQSAVIFKPQYDPGKEIVSFDFRTSKKLRLYVPMAREGEDVRNKLAAFASQHGLIIEPVDTPKMQGMVDNSLVIYDKEGELLRQLPEEEEGILELGTIDVVRSLRDADGVRKAKFPLTVFAKPL